MTTTTIPTPIEIRVPEAAGASQDHGLSLVHDMTGARRNYLHMVSVAEGSEAELYLIDADYICLHGYRMPGARSGESVQFWVYTKECPLDVERW